jgi:hypothetical protein
MKTAAGVILGLVCVVVCAGRIEAQQLSLTIRDGRVTLDARNIAIPQILEEWARVGGVRVVNGEKISAPPATLLLTAVPERQALDVLLRDVSGYLLAARPSGAQGSSAFDRILILPVSAAPRAPAPAAFAPDPAVVPRRSNARPRPVAPVADPDDRDSANRDDAAVELIEPGSAAAEPPSGVGGAVGSDVTRRPPTPMHPPPPPPPDPRNPFGTMTGAGRPGVVTPPPAPDPNILLPPVTNPTLAGSPPR